MFDPRAAKPEPSDDVRAIDCFSTQSFKLGEGIQRFRADRATLRAIEAILESPGTIPFERLKTIVEYLKGESFTRQFPGAARIDQRYFVDPAPIDTPNGAFFQGYRLHIERSYYDPEVVLGVSFKPHFVQFGDGTLMTEELATREVDGKKVSDWLVRIPVGYTLEVAREVLENRFFEIRNLDTFGLPSFGDISRVRVGTPRSLGLFHLPGRIVMNDARSTDLSVFHQLIGTWCDPIGFYGQGLHLKAACTRNPGFFRDRSMHLHNVGDIPFLLYFEAPRRAR